MATHLESGRKTSLLPWTVQVPLAAPFLLVLSAGEMKLATGGAVGWQHV